jgi:hypothetical protein
LHAFDPRKCGRKTWPAIDPLVIGIFSFNAVPIHSQFKAHRGRFFFAADEWRSRSSKCFLRAMRHATSALAHTVMSGTSPAMTNVSQARLAVV